MKDIEKAIDRLKYLVDEDLHIDDVSALETAISALEKEVPKKILKSDNLRVSGSCSVCRKAFWSMDFKEPEYCDRCGQRLNWSEVENE